MLKKQFLIFFLLFATASSLKSQVLKEEILEDYDFNINQMNEEDYIVVSTSVANLNKTKTPSLQIEKIAKSKLGIKYKWGGNGPYAYDCSGFTKEVFQKNGITLPRVSKNQAKVGKKISKRNLKKGDLVFFDDKESFAVSHVGIYLGHGKFIHASKFHKKIVISPFREYRRFFKWGRRLSTHS